MQEILTKQLSNFQDGCLGDMADFLWNYMNQVETLLHLIRATRQGEWELHLGAIEEQVKYYFAHDLYKYARLVPVYLSQMQLLKSNDKETWNSLKCGDFMVVKSGIPFTNLFVDQTLEQLIRELKVAGGITGITQNIDALDRFFLIAPELISLIQIFQHDFGVGYGKQSTKEHYQLSGTTATRLFKNSSLILKHCGGNPCALKEMKLMNITSNMQIPDNAKEDILLRDTKGRTKFEEFVTQRVATSTSDKSI